MSPWPRFVAQVFFVDLADGEQRLEPVLAAGILPPQKLVLPDRGVQVFSSGANCRPISARISATAITLASAFDDAGET